MENDKNNKDGNIDVSADFLCFKLLGITPGFMCFFWCFCAGVVVFVVVWWCFCGGLLVFLWLCFCGGVVVFLWCFCRVKCWRRAL